MILFLDFDGVLHCAYSSAASPAFCRARPLADALEGHHVSIVITSRYTPSRKHQSMEHLKGLLGPLGTLFIDKTPMLDGRQVRQREIEL